MAKANLRHIKVFQGMKDPKKTKKHRDSSKLKPGDKQHYNSPKTRRW